MRHAFDKMGREENDRVQRMVRHPPQKEKRDCSPHENAKQRTTVDAMWAAQKQLRDWWSRSVDLHRLRR